MKRATSCTVAAALAIALPAIVVAGAACRTAQTVSTWQWLDRDALLAEKIEDNDAAAVIVLRDQRWLFQLLGKYGDGRSELHVHEVVKIITEAAFERAQVRVAWPKKGKLLHLEGRTIAADGSVTVLSSDELLASEVKLDKDFKVEARFFHFPRVEVGSFIELDYAVQMDGLYTGWQDDIADALPIKKYRAEIVVDDNARPAMRVVNSTAQPRIERGGGLARAILEVENVPAAADEPLSPSWSAREPWWIYRTVDYQFPNDVWSLNADWTDAADGNAKVAAGKELAGAPTLDVSACDDQPDCIVLKATELVRNTATFTGFSKAFSHRSLQEIVDSRTANAGDKAFLLFSVLKAAGYDARLAGIARLGTNEVPRDWPSLAWLNHTMVAVVFGDRLYWIDPSCEHCGPGFLPSWVPIGSDALVTWTEGGPAKPKFVVGWWPIAAQRDPAANVERRTVAIRVAETGAAQVSWKEELAGELAQKRRVELRNDDAHDARVRAKDALSDLSPFLHLERHAAAECDREHATCVSEADGHMNHFAARDGERLVVPLDVLVSSPRFDTEEPRRSDVVIDTSFTSEDTLVIVPPAGWKVASVPAGWSETKPLLRVEVTTKKDDAQATITRTRTFSRGRVVRASAGDVGALLERAAGVSAGVVVLTK